MPTSTHTTRPPYQRPLFWVGLTAFAAWLAAAAAFRAHVRAVLDAQRQFNKRLLNPAILRLAGRPHWYTARLEHIGRRSGRRYATPVIALPVPEGLAIPLPYGADVDWCRNVRAAGGGTIEVGGIRYTLTTPRVVDNAAVLDDLPPHWRRVAQLYGFQEWLRAATEAEPNLHADGGRPSGRVPEFES
ncbi:nitroreductase family deazaflavin-dependent oxidoreductase [Pseudonocardia acidicola]|uniref:Nitroreductase family deazaflavin-dependent oxidoreductase n=1 Tax=Pseudonocardia acidicola TaxID=2724939 RepID=A0ABX1SLB0_9PSEU|nr:nitroreductase family deazaflavin-dependent oxidoreductase [Pseudonocardia acidicola]NMI01299.1 nitroreductase family deazaflavin-dependent oxidoreductase [Pseudonocardia acidicola]